MRQYRFVFLLGGRLALEAGVTGVSVSIRETEGQMDTAAGTDTQTFWNSTALKKQFSF